MGESTESPHAGCGILLRSFNSHLTPSFFRLLRENDPSRRLLNIRRDEVRRAYTGSWYGDDSRGFAISAAELPQLIDTCRADGAWVIVDVPVSESAGETADWPGNLLTIGLVSAPSFQEDPSRDLSRLAEAQLVLLAAAEQPGGEICLALLSELFPAATIKPWISGPAGNERGVFASVKRAADSFAP